MNMPAVTTQLQTLSASLAKRLDIGIDGRDLIETLKATAFKGQVTDSQMSALLIISNQYGLNPWTKEIYAYPDKGSIVPVVGVDGWARIINSHPQFDGMDFEQDDEKCTCVIYRKDRSHPIRVTEYLSECKKQNSPAWGSHPKRMLRHKALIQCARLAFGFVGIYDQDEADRILEGEKEAPQKTNVRDIASAFISSEQLLIIREKIAQSTITEEMLCEHKSIKLQTLEQLPAARFDGVINFINGLIPPVYAEYEHVNS